MNAFDDIWNRTLKKHIDEMFETTWMVCELVGKLDDERKRMFLKIVKEKVGLDETEQDP